CAVTVGRSLFDYW
nr:immunoglobulin heavy chain junction region [Macaca mulatta]MOY22120.1 immunoglobulin heavy chain junction region [Macaca mulatta]MOY22666.1 immunoglobulin heavy chain junction region [Macaca mulatta]MOY24731.1 immunoglobulin heavy chain junction region [Macaca mulatta]MOY24739.1 immunoglobulin heavy chain junction region [Macaca mulatta]